MKIIVLETMQDEDYSYRDYKVLSNCHPMKRATGFD